VGVNLPFRIRQEWIPIWWVITLIQGLLNLIGVVKPQISHIGLYPPYCSHLHPPSLFLVYNSTIITSTQTYVMHLYICMPWSWVDTEYYIHLVLHTPSTVYCDNRIYRVSVSNGSGPSLRVRDQVQTELLPNWQSGSSINLSHQLGYRLMIHSQPIWIELVVSGSPGGSFYRYI